MGRWGSGQCLDDFTLFKKSIQFEFFLQLVNNFKTMILKTKKSTLGVLLEIFRKTPTHRRLSIKISSLLP